MLAIRMQRTGRKGHAQFRVVVQDSRRTPTSARVVALLGRYDPHTKSVTLDTKKASFYLQNGAQPSERVAKLLADQGVILPDWVEARSPKTGAIRHPEKLRRNRPAESVADETPVSAEEPADEAEVAATSPAEAVEA